MQVNRIKLFFQKHGKYIVLSVMYVILIVCFVWFLFTILAPVCHAEDFHIPSANRNEWPIGLSNTIYEGMDNPPTVINSFEEFHPWNDADKMISGSPRVNSYYIFDVSGAFPVTCGTSVRITGWHLSSWGVSQYYVKVNNQILYPDNMFASQSVRSDVLNWVASHGFASSHFGLITDMQPQFRLDVNLTAWIGQMVDISVWVTPAFAPSSEGYDYCVVEFQNVAVYKHNWSDWISSVADDFYDDGYDDGYDKGLGDGYDQGYYAGLPIGYSNGYQVGHSDGYDEGYSDGYLAAVSEIETGDDYNIGYEVGYSEGYSVAVEDSITWYEETVLPGKLEVSYGEGYTEGHLAGYGEGLLSGYDPSVEIDPDSDFGDLFISLFNSMQNFFVSIFRFEVFGINIVDLVFSIFSIVIVVLVIKFLLTLL